MLDPALEGVGIKDVLHKELCMDGMLSSAGVCTKQADMWLRNSQSFVEGSKMEPACMHQMRRLLMTCSQGFKREEVCMSPLPVRG